MSIVTKSLSQAVFQILGSKHIGGHDLDLSASRDVIVQLIPRWTFPIGGPLSRSFYLQPFSRYWALSVMGSRP